jgi:hypothetical protein
MTAVEMLAESLRIRHKEAYNDLYEDIESYYKKIEKQQIIDAAADHCYPTCGMARVDAEKYYTSTYGSKGSDEHIVDTNEMVEDTYIVWECCGMEECICKGSDETK